MNTILNYLEDSQHSLLGINIKYLKLIGFSNSNNFIQNFISGFFLRTVAIFIICEYVDLFKSWGDWDLLLNNLSISFDLTIFFVKMYLFNSNFSQWCELLDTMKETELTYHDRDIPTNKKHLADCKKNIRMITWWFSWLCISAVLIFLGIPLFQFDFTGESIENYPQLIPMWLPFQDSFTGYVIGIILKFIVAFYATVAAAVYDTLIVAALLWYSCHLTMLRFTCSRIGDMPSNLSASLSHEEAVISKRIAMCHHIHLSILKCCRIFNELHSLPMFINLLMTSIMFGATVLSVAFGEISLLQIINRLMYLGTLLSELFMYYWFCNGVTIKSEEVALGAWESAWWRYGARVQRSILILMHGLSIPVVFTAGPFNTMTLATFLAILKTSYSAYALLTSASE